MVIYNYRRLNIMDDFLDKLKDGAGKAKDGAERLAKEVACECHKIWGKG